MEVIFLPVESKEKSSPSSSSSFNFDFFTYSSDREGKDWEIKNKNERFRRIKQWLQLSDNFEILFKSNI